MTRVDTLAGVLTRINPREGITFTLLISAAVLSCPSIRQNITALARHLMKAKPMDRKAAAIAVIKNQPFYC